MSPLSPLKYILLLSVVESAVLDWHGVNIPGLSFQADESGLGSVQGGGPTIPSIASLSPWLNLNCTMFRFPVLWNYIQPSFDGELDPTILNTLDALINNVTASQKYAILDIHNYARFNGVIVGQEKNKPYTWDLACLWVKLAEHYKANSYVMFGIMNEPHDLDIIQWGETVQYVINSIRQNASATEQYVLVPGTAWQGLADWVTESKIGVGNVTDPSGKMLFDVHKYFDSSGGKSGTCAPFDRANFQQFSDTMNSLNARAIVTEFGGSNNQGCNSSLNDMLSFLEENRGQFFGWTAWGASLDPSEATYLDPLSANVSTQQQPINIVRDVLVPHMMTKSSGTPSSSNRPSIRLSLNLVSTAIAISVLLH